MADWKVVAGDTEPLLYDQLEYANSEVVNLEGATVKFILRSLTAREPAPLSGEVVTVNAAEGKLYYAPSKADTSAPGNYLASWHVTFAGGEEQTFPTEGYLWLEVQPNLTTASTGMIVGLPEVLDRLQIPAQDRTQDAKLREWISAIGPLIEHVVGPITPRIYNEKFDGGSNIISLLHPPTFGYGTSPVLNILGASEFRGPIEYPLSLVANPVFGSIYSVEVNPQFGELTRRTAGGGVIAFMPGRNAVHVVYESSQAVIPGNVQMAAIETLRWWWQTTQPSGRGLMTAADAEVALPMTAIPPHAMKMLAPQRVHPAIA